MKMKRDEMKTMLSSLNLRITNFDSANKKVITDKILEVWDTKVMTALKSKAQASGSGAVAQFFDETNTGITGCDLVIMVNDVTRGFKVLKTKGDVVVINTECDSFSPKSTDDLNNISFVALMKFAETCGMPVPCDVPNGLVVKHCFERWNKMLENYSRMSHCSFDCYALADKTSGEHSPASSDASGQFEAYQHMEMKAIDDTLDIDQIDVVCPNELEWTDGDEKTLVLMRRLNPPDAPIKVNTDHLWALEEKKCSYQMDALTKKGENININEERDDTKPMKMVVPILDKDVNLTFHYVIGMTGKDLFEALNDFGMDTSIFSVKFANDISVLQYHDSLDAYNQHTFKIVPVLRGGGKDVKKTEMKQAFVKQQKKIVSDNLLKSTRVKSADVKVDAINTMPFYAELTGLVDEMITKASISGAQGLEMVITSCPSIDSLIKALQSLDTKIAKTNSIDHRMRLCGKFLMDEPMKTAIETQKSIETIVDVAQTAFLHVFMKCGAEITGFDVGNLKMMLSNRIAFIEGQTAQFSAEADALAGDLGAMAM